MVQLADIFLIFSSYVLSDSEKFLLSRGGGFIFVFPPPRCINSADVFAEVELLFMQLKRHSLAATANIAYLNVRLADLAQTFVNTTVDSQSFPWQRMHFESAKQLKRNNDIVLTTPDKSCWRGDFE